MPFLNVINPIGRLLKWTIFLSLHHRWPCDWGFAFFLCLHWGWLALRCLWFLHPHAPTRSLIALQTSLDWKKHFPGSNCWIIYHAHHSVRLLLSHTKRWPGPLHLSEKNVNTFSGATIFFFYFLQIDPKYRFCVNYLRLAARCSLFLHDVLF